MANILHKVVTFYQEVKREAHKITWPTRQYVAGSTMLIIGVVSIASILCLFIDYSVHYLISLLLKI